ncbi:hypothetical protein [uncultured Kordia sp.]|uniref:hypothetical protein n=1 Tax=uncultured Kordia sp. TaxID=507699 RepID=UPI002630DC49|nr:hypothetical protein [uncultured Kordia sp.]
MFKKQCAQYNLPIFFTNKNPVLWIRKFSKGSDIWKSHAFIDIVLRPWSTVITLADNKIKYGVETRVYKRKIIVIIILLFLLILYTIHYFKSYDSFATYIISATVFIIIFGYIYLKQLTTSGSVTILEKDISKLNISESKIAGKHFNGNVLRAPSEGNLWWEIILKISPSVSAVIVDCEDIIMESVSLKREIHHFLDTLGANRLILLTNGNDQGKVLELYPELKNSLFIKKPKRMGFRYFSAEYRAISIQIAKAIF